MRTWPNKNKNTTTLKYIGLVMLITSFLLWPAYRLAAQVNTNSANTNTTSITNTNTDSTNVNAAPTTTDTTATDADLNSQIDAKRKAAEELQRKVDLYQDNIKSKQQEALTLQNQLSLMDLQIQQAETDIERVRIEVDGVNLELDKLGTDIESKTAEVSQGEAVLSEYLRIMYKDDQKTYLEIFLSNKSFSEFFDQLKYTEDLQGSVGEVLGKLKTAKASLEQEQADKETKRQELADLTQKLSDSITTLDGQKQYKATVLIDTKNSESKFEQLLEKAKQEQQAAESEISTLESKAREKLQQGGIDLSLATTLMWPASSTKGISAYFHDPSYIFKKYFEHPAIDIRIPQGTAVRAAGNGYVVRAKNAGLGYSYVMIVHNDKLSTVYGHLSRIDVDEDSYVVRGQQIGLSGGTPGTPGAGSMTTGPHLHFEVRSGGIPVNPLDYLPAM